MELRQRARKPVPLEQLISEDKNREAKITDQNSSLPTQVPLTKT